LDFSFLREPRSWWLNRFGDDLRGEANVERLQLKMTEGFSVVGETEAAGYQPRFLQPGEVHVENRPADFEVAGELAHVRAPDEQDGDDTPPGGMVQGRDHVGQLVAGDCVV
jgi:hypothetical protein